MANNARWRPKRVTDLVKSLGRTDTFFSFEVFPPMLKDDMEKLKQSVNRMVQRLQPLFMGVSWAGNGSSIGSSIHLADYCVNELAIPTCLHLTCSRMNGKAVDGVLKRAERIGIRNLLIVRGNDNLAESLAAYAEEAKNWVPDEEYGDEGYSSSSSLSSSSTPISRVATNHMKKLEMKEEKSDGEGEKGFHETVDLVRYVRQQYGDYFCVGVTAHPENFADNSNRYLESARKEVFGLAEKVKAGASFVITNFFMDSTSYLDFETVLRNHESGLFSDLVIIPSILPLISYDRLIRACKLNRVTIPDEYHELLVRARESKTTSKETTLEHTVKMIMRIRKRPGSPHPVGFHFITGNAESAMWKISRYCKLAAPATSSEYFGRLLDNELSMGRLTEDDYKWTGSWGNWCEIGLE